MQPLQVFTILRQPDAAEAPATHEWGRGGEGGGGGDSPCDAKAVTLDAALAGVHDFAPA